MLDCLIAPLIKKYKKQYTSIIVVSFLGIALYFGLGSAYLTLDGSLTKFIDDYQMSQGDMLIDTPINDSVTVEFNSVPGIQEANARLIADIPIRMKETRLVSARAMTFNSGDFEKMFAWETCERKDYPNICLENKFAYSNGIHAGDLMEIKIGDTFQKVCVCKCVSLPECLRCVKDEFLMSENSDFGYIYIPSGMLIGSEYEHCANQFLFRFEEGANQNTALSQAKQILEDHGAVVAHYETSETSVLMCMIEEAISEVEILANFLPTIIMVCMMIIISLSISQITRMTREEIGILRALGFHSSKIRTLFCRMTLRVTCIACGIGLVIGIGVYGIVVYSYQSYFSLPEIVFSFDWFKLLVGIALTIISGLVATIIGTQRIAAVRPTEAMTRELPDSDRIPSWLDKMLEKEPPIRKFGIIALFRNRKSFLFSLICLIAAIFPIFVALSLEASHYNIVGEMTNKKIRYDAEIFFDRQQGDDLIQMLESQGIVTNCEFSEYAVTSINFKGQSKLIKLNEVDPATDKIIVYDEHGNPMKLPVQGVVLDTQTAKQLGVQLGDTVMIGGSPYVVEQFSQQNMNLTQFTSRFQKENAKPTKYTLRCNVDKADQDILLDIVSKFDGYAYTIFPDVQLKSIEKDFSAFSISIYLLIVFAILMGIVVVYNTTLTNLYSQRKSLAVLRVLGYQIKSIRRTWYIQSGAMLILALVFGIPIGMGVAQIAQELMTTEHFIYTNSFQWWQFVLTVLIALVTVVVSHSASFISMKKWNLAEMTKEKE